MKKKYLIMILVSTSALLLFGFMFVGCTLHEDVATEVGYPPVVADSVLIPDWDTPPLILPVKET